MNPVLRTHIYLLTGKVHCGKTTRAGSLVEKLRAGGEHVAGFLAPGWFEAGVRSGFFLLDVEDGSRLPLASTMGDAGWIRYGRFFFNPEALEKGRMIIGKALLKKPRLIVMDEAGPLELAGKGWSSLLDLLAGREDIRQLWVVRESLAGEVLSRWNIRRTNSLHMEDMTGAAMLEKILEEA